MRWKALIILAVMAALTALVRPGPAEAESSRRDKDKTPQVFRAIYPSAPQSLDPHSPPDPRAWPVIMAAYDRLVILEAGTAKPAPALIKTLRISPDGLRYTFVLDDNHTFSDGLKVDSQAALFTFDRLMASEVGRLYYPYLKRFELVGPYTFTLILDRPWPPFLASLALPPASLISPGLKERPAGYLSARSLGSGRYQVYDWKNETIGLKLRPDLVSRPKLDFAMFHFEPDAAARYRKTIDHQAHLVVDPDLSAGLLPGHYRQIEAPTFGVRYLAFNTGRSYMNRNVRRALSYVLAEAIDHPGRQNGPFPPGLFYNSPAEAPKMAGDTAAQGRAILREAGPPPGGALILVHHKNDPQAPAEAARLAEVLAAAGLAVKVEALEGESGRQALNAGRYDILLETRTPDIPAPDMWLGRFLDSASTPEGNPAFFSDPRADKLIDEIVSMTGRPGDGPGDIRLLEADRARKLAELAEIAEIEAPYLFLYQVHRPLIIDVRLANALPHPQWPEVWPLDLVDLKPFSHRSGVNPTGKVPPAAVEEENKNRVKTGLPPAAPTAPAPAPPPAPAGAPTINIPPVGKPELTEAHPRPLLEILSEDEFKAAPGPANPSPAPEDFIGLEME